MIRSIMDNYIDENVRHYQKMADGYDETYRNENREHVYLPFLKNLKGTSVLDVGCGPGRDSAYFISRGLDVTAIDLTSRFLELTKINAPKAKIAGPMDMRDLDFPDNSFDGLWVNLSMHHLKKSEHRRTLSEFNRVLKKDGVLFLGTFEGEGEELFYSKWSKLNRWFSFYLVEELIDLLKECHFEIIEQFVERHPSPGKSVINIFARTNK